MAVTVCLPLKKYRDEKQLFLAQEAVAGGLAVAPGSSWGCLLTRHCPGWTQITYVFPRTLAWRGPPLQHPGLPGSSYDILTSLPSFATIHNVAQNPVLEGRVVTGVKKIIPSPSHRGGLLRCRGPDQGKVWLKSALLGKGVRSHSQPADTQTEHQLQMMAHSACSLAASHPMAPCFPLPAHLVTPEAFGLPTLRPPIFTGIPVDPSPKVSRGVRAYQTPSFSQSTLLPK